MLQTFHSLAGIPCYYARVNAAYGDLSKTTSQTERGRTRKLAQGFLAQMEAMVLELYWLTYSTHGPLTAITSGGAYVNKPGWHKKGKAFDLGGLFWADGQEVLTCLDLAKRFYRNGDPGDPGPDYPLYLGCEAVIRRHFGTVLGIHYNRRHWNHWHIDPGTAVGFWSDKRALGATTRVTFLQCVLKTIWGSYAGRIDGDAGPLTQAAIAEVREDLTLGPLTDEEQWMRFLLFTALAAFHM